jgi:hypothetical protein
MDKWFMSAPSRAAVFLAMQRDQAGEQIRSCFRHARFSWDSFLEIASGHVVISALEFQLKFHGVWDEIPAEIRDVCEGTAELSRLRIRDQSNELVELTLYLRSLGVTPLLLKGAAGLAEGLYQDSACRVMMDLDVLVPAAQLRSCVDLLHSEGYTEERDAPDVSPAREEAFTDDALAHTRHYPRLFSPKEGLGIELHAHLFAVAHGGLVATESILSSATQRSFHGVDVLVPSLRDQVVHNILHGTEEGTFLFTGAPAGLRQACDFMLLAELLSPAMWDDIVQDFRRAGKFARLSLYLAFLNRWLNVRQPLQGTTAGERALYGMQKLQVRLAYQPAWALFSHVCFRSWSMLRQDPLLNLRRQMKHPTRSSLKALWMRARALNR